MSSPNPKKSSRRLIWVYRCSIGIVLSVSSGGVIVFGLLAGEPAGVGFYVTAVIGLAATAISWQKLRQGGHS